MVGGPTPRFLVVDGDDLWFEVPVDGLFRSLSMYFPEQWIEWIVKMPHELSHVMWHDLNTGSIKAVKQ
jgi:hypothetical protein